MRASNLPIYHSIPGDAIAQSAIKMYTSTPNIVREMVAEAGDGVASSPKTHFQPHNKIIIKRISSVEAMDYYMYDRYTRHAKAEQ